MSIVKLEFEEMDLVTIAKGLRMLRNKAKASLDPKFVPAPGHEDANKLAMEACDRLLDKLNKAEKYVPGRMGVYPL